MSQSTDSSSNTISGIDVTDEFTEDYHADWQRNRTSSAARDELIAATVADLGRLEADETDGGGEAAVRQWVRRHVDVNMRCSPAL